MKKLFWLVFLGLIGYGIYFWFNHNYHISKVGAEPWKVYSTGSYSIEYPESWFLNAGQSSHILIGPDKDNAATAVIIDISKGNNMTIEELAEARYSGKPYSQQYFNFGGADAVRIYPTCDKKACGPKEIYSIKKNQIYHLYSASGDEDMFHSITSTFKFK